jgi:hypothetical protein
MFQSTKFKDLVSVFCEREREREKKNGGDDLYNFVISL